MHRQFFHIKVTDFFNYIQLMEGSIESHKLSLDKQFEEQALSLENPDDKQDLFEYHFLDDYFDLDQTYTFILRKSLFITLYSFMESELQSIARKIEKQQLTNIKLNDISHSGLQQYLFYLETVNKINVDLSQNDRDKFVQYNTLRNYFVHNERKLIEQNKYNQLKTIPYITFEIYPIRKNNTAYSVNKLEKSFNQEYLNLIELFFVKLYQGLKKTILHFNHFTQHPISLIE